jgi:hypothetical protein
MEKTKGPSVKNSNVYVFVDASNLWAAQKSKARFLDYDKTTKHIKKMFNTNSVKVFYYTAYPAEGTRNYNLDNRHKFYTFLKKGLGFTVIKKELKRINYLAGKLTRYARAAWWQ